jgi:hypothetical protein
MFSTLNGEAEPSPHIRRQSRCEEDISAAENDQKERILQIGYTK